MTELPDNATPEQARDWAGRRLAQGASRDHLATVARRLRAYQQHRDVAQAILAVANRPAPRP